MYCLINNLPVITKAATEIVMQMDRMKYRDIYFAIEQAATDPKIMLGGPMGFAILANEGSTTANKDTFFYDIFTSDVESFAPKFIDQLSGLDAPYKCSINIEVTIPRKLYVLWVDLRPIARIMNLEKYRGVEIRDLIVPVLKQSILFPELQVHCVSGNVYMMEIYQKLYSPYPSADYKTYQELCEIEDSVYKFNSAALLATQFVGGAEEADLVPFRAYISQILLDGGHFSKLSGNTALIGDYAIKKYIPGMEMRDPRLQIVTDVGPEVVETLVKAIIDKIGAKEAGLPRPIIEGGPRTPGPGSSSPGTPVDVQKKMNEFAELAQKTQISVVSYQLNIPGNFYLQKHTVYITTGKTNQVFIFDFFNNPVYEVLPFSPGPRDNRYIGLFAIIYFKLVDLWAMKLIKGLKLKSSPDDRRSIAGLDNKMKDLARQIDKVRNYTFEQAQADPLRVFQIDNFIGNHYVESVKKKKFIGRVMMAPFYLCDKKEMEKHPITTASHQM